jgi:hypothetical protein
VDELPSSLREYLDVWCADLLDPLTAPQRDQVCRLIESSYSGGPWPPRLVVQRMCELITGLIDIDAFIGDVTTRWGYRIDDAVRLLSAEDCDERANAMVLLGRYPDTTELVEKVTAAHRVGTITDAEFNAVCTAALRRPLLPPPLAPPAHLPLLPADYPESNAEFRRREPDFTPPLTADTDDTPRRRSPGSAEPRSNDLPGLTRGRFSDD